MSRRLPPSPFPRRGWAVASRESAKQYTEAIQAGNGCSRLSGTPSELTQAGGLREGRAAARASWTPGSQAAHCTHSDASDSPIVGALPAASGSNSSGRGPLQARRRG